MGWFPGLKPWVKFFSPFGASTGFQPIRSGWKPDFTPARVAAGARRWFPHDLESSLDSPESNLAWASSLCSFSLSSDAFLPHKIPKILRVLRSLRAKSRALPPQYRSSSVGVCELEIVSVMFVLLVIVNVLVFLHESSLGLKALRQFVWQYAFIPSKLGFTGGSMMPKAPADLLQKISPMVTSQFLHAGWLHLLSNMVVLLFLGKKLEERIGPLKFLAFYLASGIAGNIVYAAFHLSSHEPVLGASGAVAGVLAASLLCNPNGIVWLPGLPIFLTVWMFAPLWFFSELLNAINEQNVRSTPGGVAYLVHVGGFVFGLVSATAFPRADRLGKDRRA
jgi:membrane associated rhomboid family serine protease